MNEVETISTSADIKHATASSWKKRLPPQIWGKLVLDVLQQHQNIESVHTQYLLCSKLLICSKFL